MSLKGSGVAATQKAPDAPAAGRTLGHNHPRVSASERQLAEQGFTITEFG
jgi:hypothetical protein